jgi:hypothetical protein
MEHEVREDGVYNKFGVRMMGSIYKGYRCLCLNGKKYREHRLIAEKFIPNPDNKPHINHIDGNKSNNSIDNLEWVTPSENQLHSYKTGLSKPLAKDNNPYSKLKSSDTPVIRQRFSNGEKIQSIRKDYNVSYSTIWRIVNNKGWIE